MAKSKKRKSPAKQAPKVASPAPWKIPYWVLLTVALIFCALMLSPLLRSGYLGDDGDSSLATPGALAYMKTPILQLTWDMFTRWVTTQGRLYPLSLYVQPLFYVLGGNRLAYKLLIMALVIACAGLFSWLVRRVSGSDALGIAAAIAPSLAFQFMYFYDSLLGFAGMLQMVFLYLVGSLLLFTFYLERGRRRYLVWSVVLYLASLLTYEMTFPFFLLHVLLASFYPERRPLKDAFRKAMPHAVVAVGLAVALIVLRLSLKVAVTAGGATPSPYAISFDVGQYLRALCIQVLGAWPLSYSTFGSGVWGRTDLFQSPWSYLATFPVTSLIAFTGYAALTWVVARTALSEPKRTASGKSTVVGLVWFGGAMMVLSGAMIALSPRWHTELVWGAAYLPVFVGYFGSALVLSVLAYVIVRAWGRGPAGTVTIVALACVVGLVGMTNLQNNRAVVTEWDSWRYGRDTIADATDNGIFGKGSANSLLLVNNRINGRQPWDVPQFYAEHGTTFANGVVAVSSIDTAALKKAASSTNADASGGQVFEFAETQPVYFIDYTADAASGYVLAERVSSVTVNGTSVTDIQMQPVAVYMTAPKAPRFDSFFGPTKTLVPAASLESLVDPATFKVESSGPGWQLYRATAASDS